MNNNLNYSQLIRLKIPIVWEQYKDEADEEYNDRMESYQRGGRAKGDPKPSPRMVKEEDKNFLRFATALKMLIGRSIRRDQLPRIKSLLQEYLLTFERVRGILLDIRNGH